MPLRHVSLTLLCLLSLTSAATAQAAPDPAVWIADGTSHITIVAEPAILRLRVDPKARVFPDAAPLHWAVTDLADYLGQISGVRPDLAASAIPGTMPVRVRVKAADEDLGATSEFGDAYRIDITADGADLVGESPRAAAYAAYHILHELGVRWYGPEPWNEHVPTTARVALGQRRQTETPAYRTRHLWGVSQRWLVRNRMGGPMMPQGHGFHAFMQGMEPRDAAPLVERHPDYYPIVDGKVIKLQANLSHPEVLKRAVEHARQRFASRPHELGLSLGPDDGTLLDERPETRALMSGRNDPLLQHRPDSTDLLIGFINRVAEQLEPEHPDKLLGFYVYSNHHTVPTVTPHRMLHPTIAPITYNRYTSIGAKHAVTSAMLQEVIQKWAALAEKTGFYLYNFNLGDRAMPFTRVAAFRRDLPNLHRWGLPYATIESGANWHTMIPGNYMIGRLLWDIDTDVDALLDEFYPAYYGPAAAFMREHDRLLEDAYESTAAYSGNLWAMHRILTPEVMAGLRGALDESRRLVGDTEPYARRLTVPGYSLRFAESWFAARAALNRGDLAAAAAASQAYLDTYAETKAAGLTTDEPSWLGGPHGNNFFSRQLRRYWEIFHQPTFLDAGRLATTGSVVLALPDEWHAFLDTLGVGAQLGLESPQLEKSHWPRFRTYSATIDEHGFPLFRGIIWYARDVVMPAFPRADGEELFLWFGGNDSATSVFIDGTQVGGFEVSNFGPGELLVTPHLTPGRTHHLVVAVDNRQVHEIGTGGIMRPVILYTRKLRDGEQPAVRGTSGPAEQKPLFTGEQ